jgi:hypothetical protein
LDLYKYHILIIIIIIKYFRKVSLSEAEEYAKKKNCAYFEVSAKTDENIKKMLYSSLVELPFFDKYKKDNNIDDLIEELDNDNNNNVCMNNSGLNNSGMLESSRNNNNILNINSDRDDSNNLNKREKCKC